MDWEWFKAAAGRGACMWPCQGRGRRSPAEGLDCRATTGGLCSAHAQKKKEENKNVYMYSYSMIEQLAVFAGWGLV